MSYVFEYCNKLFGNCLEIVLGFFFLNNSNVCGCLKLIYFDFFLKLMVKNKLMSVGNWMYKVICVEFFLFCVF